MEKTLEELTRLFGAVRISRVVEDEDTVRTGDSPRTFWIASVDNRGRGFSQHISGDDLSDVLRMLLKRMQG